MVKVFTHAIQNVRPSEIWNVLQTLMSVCRHWYDVALNAKVLWRVVHVEFGHGAEQRVAQRMLERSSPVPLHLNVGWLSNDEPLGLDFLVPEFGRVETLYIEYNRYALSSLLYNMPMLRELHITCRCYPVPAYPLVDPKIHYTRLQSLRMDDGDYRLVVPFLRPGLRHLTLRRAYDCSSTREFLLALREMPELEELDLDRSFTSDLSPAESTVIVTLPNLKTLSIREDSTACVEILESIVIPASTFLGPGGLDYIHSNGRSRIGAQSAHAIMHDQSYEFGRVCAAIGNKLAGNGLLNPAQIPAIQRLELIWPRGNMRYGVLVAVYETLTSQKPFFDFALGMDRFIDVGDALRQICSFMPKSVLATVRSLSALGHPSIRRSYTIDQAMPDGLSNLDGLETMELQWSPQIGRYMVNAHLEWLKTTGISVEALRSGAEVTITTPLPWPSLRRLELVGAMLRNPPQDSEFDDEVVEEDLDENNSVMGLITMVQIRQACNAALEELVLRAPKNIIPSDLKCLKCYVGKVMCTDAWDC